MARDLFLHEVIDITGQGAVPYMEHTVAFDTEGAAAQGLTLFGTWQVMGSTGRWPQVVNLWQLLDGWEGWRRLCDRTNLRRAANPELAQWWEEAYRHRAGGFDRLLAATPLSPTPDALVEAGVTGTVFVHELTTVRPGAAGPYLTELVERWAPIAADYGLVLAGAWEVLLTDTEVCSLWATDLDAHIAFMAAAEPGGNPQIAAWRKRARSYTTTWREELMTPGAGTLLAPP